MSEGDLGKAEKILKSTSAVSNPSCVRPSGVGGVTVTLAVEYRTKTVGCREFHLILTPHFQERFQQRQHLVNGICFSGEFILGFYRKAEIPNQVYVARWQDAYVKGYKMFNPRRKRWELVWITIHDTRHHFSRHMDAKLIEVS